MDPNIIIILLFTLFAGGHSLACYDCSGMVSSCKHKTCDNGADTCGTTTVTISTGGTENNMNVKSCERPQVCGNGSINVGVTRVTVSMQCCNRDLCNNHYVPDYNSNHPNGQQCYFCNEKGCYNKLNCVGTEDYCMTAKASAGVQSATVKGCASKSICEAVHAAPEFIKEISCCQGNLCNSAKSITYSLLILSWPYISYIMLH